MDATPPPRREWRAARWSGPQLYYLGCLALGLGGIGECAALLSAHRTDLVPGASFAGLFGVIFTLIALGLLIVPARRVERLDDGSFRFVAPLRRLRVGAGELVSIRCLVPDPSRLWPMRVTATRGRILMAPRIDDVGGLCRELLAATPAAGITDPEPFSRRTFRAPEP